MEWFKNMEKGIFGKTPNYVLILLTHMYVNADTR